MGSGAWRSVARVSASKDGCGPDPDPRHGGQDLAYEGGARQGHRPGRRHQPAECAGR